MNYWLTISSGRLEDQDIRDKCAHEGCGYDERAPAAPHHGMPTNQHFCNHVAPRAAHTAYLITIKITPSVPFTIHNTWRLTAYPRGIAPPYTITPAQYTIIALALIFNFNLYPQTLLLKLWKKKLPRDFSYHFIKLEKWSRGRRFNPHNITHQPPLTSLNNEKSDLL